MNFGIRKNLYLALAARRPGPSALRAPTLADSTADEDRGDDDAEEHLQLGVTHSFPSLLVSKRHR